MSTRNKSISYHIGNLLITLSLAGLFFIYWPIVALRFFPTDSITLASDDSYSISIPKLKLQSPVIENVDPWDPDVYQEALTRGIAHAKGSSPPGVGGGTYLFAHSSDVPWRLTRYNTVFLRIGELNRGDEVKVVYEGEEHVYRVREIKEVWPSEVEHLVNVNESEQLILQTCSPIGTALKRLLVFADPV